MTDDLPPEHDSNLGLSVILDTTLFSEEVAFRASYRFTDRCFIRIDRARTNQITVRFRSKDGSPLHESVVGEFENELIDQRLRMQIASETALIRELIVAQAFAEADFGATREDGITNPGASQVAQ